MPTELIGKDDEVEGSMMLVIRATEADDGTVTRTALGETTKDDAELEIDEDDEDFNPSNQRRTKRYRTNNTADATVSMAVTKGLSQLETIGIVDSNGKLTFDSSDRQWGPNDWLEFAYFRDEPRLTDDAFDVVADAEQFWRCGDIEVASPDFDSSSSPIMCEFTAWVNGDIWINYTEDGSSSGGATS